MLITLVKQLKLLMHKLVELTVSLNASYMFFALYVEDYNFKVKKRIYAQQ